MSVSIHGSGSIVGIDQGIQISGVSTFTGNVSIGGTLSYEDVTSIDSVGIITANAGIDVTAGGIDVTAGGINVVGVVTATTFSGNLTGTIAGTSTIAGISSSISDTAVDVFIYDTSKDSDGGAWRKRTQNTSWYNETLGTATRGSRKEFPAVAVIVATEDDVIIYDGDDPDLPMWMIFESSDTGTPYDTHYLGRGSGFSGFHPSITSVAMLNGILVVSKDGDAANYAEAYTEIRFISDRALHRDQTSASDMGNAISGRNGSAGGRIPNSSYGGLAHFDLHDVAMTVLTNAPIDSATGLPIPTIAVATAGGVSVIKGDGTVVDTTSNNGSYTYARSVEWASNGDLLFVLGDTNGALDYLHTYDGFNSSDNVITVDTKSGTTKNVRSSFRHADTTTAYASHQYDGFTVRGSGGAPNYAQLHPVAKKDSFEYGVMSPQGLTHISENPYSKGSLVAYATTSYNTGWMHGDIKGAFLSDTSTTNISSTNLNLITNGDFSNGTTGWSNDSTPTFTVSGGGVASVDRNGGGATGQCYQTITTEVGRTYTVGVLISAVSDGFQIYAGKSPSSANIAMSQGAINSTGTHYWTFTAATTSTRLDFSATQNTSGTASFDNITIFDGVADRSVNAKGLRVLGTVTKSAVATGADLVAYSGFSASNLFVQPYNSDLNPGTGDYSFTLWFKCPSTGAEQIYMRRFGVPTVTGGTMMRLVSSSSVLQWYVRDTSSTATAVNSSMALDDGSWHCAVGTREGATAKLYIDGKLDTTSGCSANSHDPGTTSSLVIGAEEITAAAGTYQNPADLSSMALIRYSLSAPSAEQIKKIYEDEKFLFQENAKATLHGSSDAVTALAYDEVTDQLHLGTSSGRSDFQGLRRINNTTTAVTTAISAHDEFIIEQ